MGSLPPELSLPAFIPRAIGDYLRNILAVADAAEGSSNPSDLVSRLEDEMRKIDAFKRELPFCMVLLGYAIEFSKLELTRASAPPVTQPVTAEFMPLKKDCHDTGTERAKQEEKEAKDGNLGQLDLQLCTFDNRNSSSVHSHEPQQDDVKVELKRHESLKNQTATEDEMETCKSRDVGRELVQLRVFSPTSVKGFPSKENKVELPVHSLSLRIPGAKNPTERPVSADTMTKYSQSLAQTLQSNSRSGSPPQQQGLRKQRRCWSPELHRRFVNALQQLGGSQAATPKQIRELMHVDGLTNDEVKSHLQKYRLHTRRLPNSAASPTNQPARVLGTLWPSRVQQDDAISKKQSNSQSGSPDGPLQLYCASTTTGGDSMEDEDDSKSKSFSWKSHHRTQRTNKVAV